MPALPDTTTDTEPEDDGPGACVMVFNANDPSGAAGIAADLMAVALAHPDAAEGANSFIERRPPAFAPWTGEA